MMNKTAMISGHLDLTEEEFKEHYQSLIEQAIQEGCNFVVGDARGADFMAQTYLFHHCPISSNVTVYHMLEHPRNHYPIFDLKGGYQSNSAKDKAMTGDSDFDIAWVRPEKHSSVSRRVSGTEQNLIRRKAKRMGK
jgi:hypothetical protein